MKKVILILTALITGIVINAQKSRLDSTWLNSNNENVNWNGNTPTVRGKVTPKFNELKVGSQFTGIGLVEINRTGNLPYAGFPVGLHIRQLDNGSYAWVITNETSDQNYPGKFVSWRGYLGNDGDAWSEAYNGSLSAQIGLNPLNKTITLMPAKDGSGNVHIRGGLFVDGKTPLYKDADGNVNLGTGNTLQGVQNFVGLNNGSIKSHESFLWVRNVIVDPNSLGSYPVGLGGFGADTRVIHGPSDGVNYSFFAGDAHNISGYSSTTFGFGNYNSNTYGLVVGNNNVLGGLTKTEALSSGNLYKGGAILGQNNFGRGEVYAIGKGMRLDGDGIYLGYVTPKLKVLPSGAFYLNGLLFPSDLNPPVGSVLTVISPGVLGWTTPETVTRASQQTKFQTWKLYDLQGRYIGIVKAQ
jgi:hypothetical protein